MTESDPLDIAGTVIADKYLVEAAVGRGGFAVVYRAVHAIWKRPVAIKFFNELCNLPVEQRDDMQRAFVDEGALLTELSSHTPGIVQARDIGTHTTADGRWMPFMVLEWLDGKTLEQVLGDEAAAGHSMWSLSEVMRLLGPVAAALDVAHRRGIAHRDVKPANIFVMGDPRGDASVKLLDFGVAKLITDSAQRTAALARTGTRITSFTPQYGAPEQFTRSHGATGPWTDVFALALVAAEMLSGRPALEGGDLVQCEVASRSPNRRPTPRQLGAGIPDAVEEVFAKAVAVRPELRFATASEFWGALSLAAASVVGQQGIVTLFQGPPGGADTTARSAVTEVGPRAERRRRLWLPAGLLGVAALGGITALVTAGTSSSARMRKSSAAALTASARLAGQARPAACPPGMFEIPRGQFYMGSDASEAPSNQAPAHNVSLRPFCLDGFEVTAADYVACSRKGACRRLRAEVSYPGMRAAEEEAFTALCNVEARGRAEHPMNCVGWQDAETFCRKSGKRLPTEAEWEYATRGPDGRVFPWGDDAPSVEHLNACDRECARWSEQAKVPVLVLFEIDSDGHAATAPVGKFPKGRSRFGPWDVVGNVWEWVADWEGAYSAGEQEDPKGPAMGRTKIIRGGAWNGARPEWLHPSFRFAAEPTRRHPAIGFRCAADLTGSNDESSPRGR